jgi:type VII secretion-associated serine protease mycosin
MNAIGARRLAAATVGVLVGLTTVLVSAAPAHAKNARDLEWWLDALHVEQIHQQLTDGSGVIVAVVDAGVDGTHPDLAGRVLQGHGGPNGNGWATGQAARHGTEMAGIIAGGKPGGYVGIAPGAKILPVFEAGDRDMSDGIRWAVDHGAKVINLSIGSNAATQDYEVDAVRYAEDHDVVLVASSGNTPQDGTHGVIDPARIPGVVAVGALDQQANLWWGSEPGPEVAITAPGVDIITPAPLDTSSSGYASGTGTSEATAFVSGVAALIRAKYPKLNAASVIQRLIATAKDAGAPGRDPQYGYGIMRPLLALTNQVDAVTVNPLGSAAGPSPGAGATTGTGSGGSTRSQALSVLLPVAGGILLLVVVVTVIVVAVSRRRRPVPVGRPPGPPGWPPPPPPPPR